MALTKESMADSIQAAVAAVGSFQAEGGSPDPVAQSRIYLEAWCQGIIDEFQSNAKAIGTDSGGDGHNLSID